jgi:uncharacterized membrane protein YhaH (DUF805 family)
VCQRRRRAVNHGRRAPLIFPARRAKMERSAWSGRLAQACVLQSAAKHADVHATGDDMGSEMGSMSLISWIVVLIILLVYLLPVIKILHKAGYSGWWVLLLFIPVVNIIFLWVFAYADWPSLRGSQGRPT